MSLHPRPPLEIWGGPECTLNRVRGAYFDQTCRSGHDERIEDLDRFAGLGISALRYPVLWERIAPESWSRPRWHWTDQRLERLFALGVRPIAGLLHHGSGPAYTSLVDPLFPIQATAEALDWQAPRPRYSALYSVRGKVMRSTSDALAAFAATWPQHAATVR